MILRHFTQVSRKGYSEFPEEILMPCLILKRSGVPFTCLARGADTCQRKLRFFQAGNLVTKRLTT